MGTHRALQTNPPQNPRYPRPPHVHRRTILRLPPTIRTRLRRIPPQNHRRHRRRSQETTRHPHDPKKRHRPILHNGHFAFRIPHSAFAPPLENLALQPRRKPPKNHHRPRSAPPIGQRHDRHLRANRPSPRKDDRIPNRRSQNEPPLRRGRPPPRQSRQRPPHLRNGLPSQHNRRTPK